LGADVRGDDGEQGPGLSEQQALAAAEVGKIGVPILRVHNCRRLDHEPRTQNDEQLLSAPQQQAILRRDRTIVRQRV
jgi:hypothetical protein